MQPAETFSLNGIPWPLWELNKIPTLGASPTSCRVQVSAEPSGTFGVVSVPFLEELLEKTSSFYLTTEGLVRKHASIEHDLNTKQLDQLFSSDINCFQEMYKVTLPPTTPTSKHVKVFVKSIPVTVWRKQWENQNKWAGEYVTDGENFVMEAAALAFLQREPITNLISSTRSNYL